MAETKHPTRTTPTSSQSSNAETPQAPDLSAERQALTTELRDRTNRAFEARMLLDLLQWIENARQVVEQVQLAATYNDDVRKGLDDHRIAYNLPWEESDGLCRLIGVIHELNGAVTVDK